MALIVGCAGYLVRVGTDLPAPTTPAAVGRLAAAIGGLPKLIFAGWLVVVGARVRAR